MAPLLGGKEIPVLVNWSKIYGSTESAPSVYATTVQIKRDGYATVSEKLHGNEKSFLRKNCFLLVPQLMLVRQRSGLH